MIYSKYIAVIFKVVLVVVLIVEVVVVVVMKNLACPPNRYSPGAEFITH